MVASCGSGSISRRMRLYQHIDKLRSNEPACALREIEQAVTRQYAAGTLAEGSQQVEFGAGQSHPRPRRICAAPQPEIDPPSQKGEGGRALVALTVWRPPGGATPH